MNRLPCFRRSRRSRRSTGSPLTSVTPSHLAQLAGRAGIVALGAVAGLGAPASAVMPVAPAKPPVIEGKALAASIRYLSSDALEGRGPGSPGDRDARSFLAAELAKAGLEPGGTGGTWEQPFPMIGITSKPPATWTFSGPQGKVDLAQWDEFIAASGVQATAATLTGAEVVFVGYGIQAPEFDWDDFKGVDLKGKVLLMLNNDPDWDPALFAGRERLYYGRWSYKYESAARQGAAGAIIVHTTPSAGYPFQVVQTSWSGEQFELPAGSEPRLEVRSWVTEEAAQKILALSGKSLADLVAAAQTKAFRPVPLGVRTSLALTNGLRQVETANVAGLLPGSDPVLKNEVVIYTAHHDHLGIGAPDKKGDKIYNGAVDNASGCAEVLEIARALAANPQHPRRSMLFLFVAAEEQGLLGSKYYATHPTFAPGKIAADINVDSANIYGRTTDIAFVGRGKSSLDKVVEAVAARQELQVLGDQAPEKGSFYRSDQFSFAHIGVPAIYLKSGEQFVGDAKTAAEAKARKDAYDATCYHQPCDEIGPEWNFDGMIQQTQFALACGLEIANATPMPEWTPGNEFEATRKKALLEAGTPVNSGKK
ncbi:MAG: M28 family peptidase [Thermoanaerobaculia bacterium]